MLYTAAVIRCVLSLLAVAFAIPLFCSDCKAAHDLMTNSGAESGIGNKPAAWEAAKVAADGLQMERVEDKPFKDRWSLYIGNSCEYDRPVSNNWFQRLSQLPTGKVRIRAAVRTEHATAANVCLQCWSEERRMIGFVSTQPLTGTNPWSELQSEELSVPAGTKEIVIRAALTGTGHAWFDEIRVEMLSIAPRATADSQPVPSVLERPRKIDASAASQDQASGKTDRGICILSSSIGKEVPVEQVISFVRVCRLNFVVIDFAWITHHWSRTSDDAVELSNRLHEMGIEVMVMYRPRVLSSAEASVHYLTDTDGKVPASYASLDFRFDDSTRWGADWGSRLLRRFPRVSTVLLYNLHGPREVTKGFLKHCRTQWKEVREGVSIGHVGSSDDLAEVVDLMLPFVAVNRFDGQLMRPATQAKSVVATRTAHPSKRVIPLLKVDWADDTNNDTHDIAAAVDACEAFDLGYALWTFNCLFDGTRKYDSRILLSALGDQSAKPTTDAVPTTLLKKATLSLDAPQPHNDPREWAAFHSREAATDRPALAAKTPGGNKTIECVADTQLISYLPGKAWGKATILAISRNDSNRPLLSFPLRDVTDEMNHFVLTLTSTTSSLPLTVPLEVEVFRVSEQWEESSDNWSTQPVYLPDPKVQLVLQPDAKTLEADISTLVVAARKSGADTLTLLLKSAETNGNRSAPPVTSSRGRQRPMLRTNRLPVPDLQLPPTESKIDSLPWPHQPPAVSREEIARLNDSVWIINDSPLYQADHDGRVAYLHGGLDIVLDPGTPIYAMKDGWVKFVEHGTVAVADTKSDDPSFGWEYTHLGEIAVHTGDHVKRGDLLGRVEFKGLPHLHLTKVFSQGRHWGEWSYVCYPNAHFDYSDSKPPVIHQKVLFVENESDKYFQTDADGSVVVNGKVDIIAAMREEGEYAHHRSSGFGDRLAVTRIEYEIHSADGALIQKRASFDFTRLTYLKSLRDPEYNRLTTTSVYRHWPAIDRQPPTDGKTFSYYTVSNSPADSPPRSLLNPLGENCWDTMALKQDGTAQFPDGDYRITIRAFDFKGHSSELSAAIKIRNKTD